MRTVLILLLAFLIAGCGAANVQVMKPVNGDVKQQLRPELQKDRCFIFVTGEGGGEVPTKKTGQSSSDCIMSIDEVVNRVTVLAYLGKDSYTAESGEKHVIARRARGNRDIEVTGKYYYQVDSGARGIEVFINDFTDPNFDKDGAPPWAVKAIYREVLVKDNKLVLVKDGMSREEFFETDRTEHYKMLNNFIRNEKR